MPRNELYTRLISEYTKAKNTLISNVSKDKNKTEIGEFVQTVFALCTKLQADYCTKMLPTFFRAGYDFEATNIKALLKAKEVKVISAVKDTPYSIKFDFTKVSKTHLNKITRDVIGEIGIFNREISKALLKQYDVLLANNELVNNIIKKGFTDQTETQLLKLGIAPEMIAVIKSQSTTSKMISILEQNGIRGGMHPKNVAKLLVPEIRKIFGSEGVIINNVGKIRRELKVNAEGEYWWKNVVITKPYHTTIENYALLIADTAIKRAHNDGRFETMQQSGIVEKYRYICTQSANSCIKCLALHAKIVGKDLRPPIHGKCHCYLAAVYKDSYLNLHTDDYYEKQRSAGLYREYKFREYNKTLPRGEKIINANFLPPEYLKNMPSGEKLNEMLATLF